jgi:hypothetical protein
MKGEAVLDRSEREPDANAHCSTPELKAGQIRYLYLWVHPQWSLPFHIPDEMNVYKKFFQRLVPASRVGVVQIPFTQVPLSPSSHYHDFVQALDEVNHYATKLIGERYVVWDQHFFRAKDEQQEQKLIDRFRLVVADQTAFVAEKDAIFAKKPKHLARIMVFGKEEGTCPVHQVYECGLNTLSAVVKYIDSELPQHIRPPQENDPSTLINDGMHVI